MGRVRFATRIGRLPPLSSQNYSGLVHNPAIFSRGEQLSRTPKTYQRDAQTLEGMATKKRR